MKISQKTREFLLKCGNSPKVTLMVLVFSLLTIMSLGGIDELLIGGVIIIALVVAFLLIGEWAKKKNAS